MNSDFQMEKVKQIPGIFREDDTDLWLIWVRETSQMADPVLELIYSGEFVWQSALLFVRNGEHVAIVGNFDSDATKSAGLFDRVIPYTESIREPLIQELKRIAPKKIAINYSKNDVAADGLSHGMYLILQDYLGDSDFKNRFVSAENIVSKLRGRKTPTEMERIKKAVQITESIFEEARTFLKVGMTEIEIQSKFHEAMNRHGVGFAWNKDHNPAVDAGPYKQFGHSGPTSNITKEGHLLHFDFGVKYQDYCSDIQRMFFFGKPEDVPEQVQHAFETVRDAIQAAADWIRPGAVGYEVDAIAREFVKDSGYEEYQHALGHQVGRQAHDGGALLGPRWERYGDTPMGVVEVGNVFTLELYVTTENYGQVSLEEDILITRKGCELLSRPQKELICI
ncbi:MAG: M24 family metallopeptidase [Candidatus Thorarchaeota archaeon]|jgi:Xaa-Pro aminopeptidase